MRIPRRDELFYRSEKFFAKGGLSVFFSLMVTFVLFFLFIVGMRFVFYLFIKEETQYINSFGDHVWLTFLEMTDPGNMTLDTWSSKIYKIWAIIAGLAGVVIFSALIAFITTGVEKSLYEFRKGRSKVLEENHTLILGWNSRVTEILKELIIANESEKKASVVILAETDKEVMDTQILKQIQDTNTTNVITRSGSPASLYEMSRVSAEKAKSVIVLKSCPDNADEEEKKHSDIQSMKTIMAIIAVQNGQNRLPIIVEIFNQTQRELLREFSDNKIISLDTWQLMGRLLLQTSLTNGLERVYQEILSFRGNELYYYKDDWKGRAFKELIFHFEDGVPLGILNAKGQLKLRPNPDRKMKPSDEVLVLAEDDSTIKYSQSPIYKPKELDFRRQGISRTKRKILILGWHEIGSIYIDHSAGYITQGSVFDIMIDPTSKRRKERIEDLKLANKHAQINIIEKTPLIYENIKEMQPYEYDKVIILSIGDENASADQIDADTLIVLFMLKKLKRELKIKNKSTKIITQILNSDNQDLLFQTEVDDFITSNKLTTMIIAQLSEDPKIKQAYDEIFDTDGSEIYLKPITFYTDSFPLDTSFGNLIALASKRKEILLGIRKSRYASDKSLNYGIILNPKKGREFTIEEDDTLIVLSADEQ